VGVSGAEILIPCQGKKSKNAERVRVLPRYFDFGVKRDNGPGERVFFAALARLARQFSKENCLPRLSRAAGL